MSYTNGLDKPSDYFNTKLYTGTGGTQAITGVGFQPDWVWLKARSSAYSHQLFDVVRGATKLLSSEETSAEQTLSGVTAFGSDGFTVGSDAGSNNNTTTFASWNWLAGGSASSNTDGSITSTVSANTTSGFSIVSYTGNNTAGATIGHGLGVAPSMMIVKSRNSANPWIVYHKSIGETKAMYLNLTIASYTATNIWNDTAPTSSVFSVGSNDDSTNKSNEPHIAYCFAEKQGYSKFGSFVGSSSQQFVYLGFKPRWFLWKNTSQGNSTFDHWGMVDTARQTPNGATDGYLRANQSSAESSFSGNGLFFLSNGIQFNNTGRYNNNSGDTYIFMAFAENPFVSSSGVPACAR